MDPDELYGLPLSDFTKARDDLARRLRNEGKREEADAVKALRKPTVPAWALNQIARKRPRDIARLLSTGARLRKAHEALLAGGDRSSMQKASAAERELIDKLTRDATALAGEAGRASTAALDERIRGTLHAAALDADAAADLAAGRLTHEREAVGLFGAGDAEPAQAPKARKRAPDQDLERALAAARSDERKAKSEHANATKAAERARNRAAAAAQRAEHARAGMREAEQRERDAAKALDRAARAVAAAEKKRR